jgi:hypothetical protein
VAVNGDAEWHAIGNCDCSEESSIDEAMSEVCEPSTAYILEAEVPIPVPQVIPVRDIFKTDVEPQSDDNVLVDSQGLVQNSTFTIMWNSRGLYLGTNGAGPVLIRNFPTKRHVRELCFVLGIHASV